MEKNRRGVLTLSVLATYNIAWDTVCWNNEEAEGDKRVIMDGKDIKNHKKIQKYVSKINKLEKQFGGYRPDLINMYFAAKLECLTKALIILTAVLAVLTITQIILLIQT